MEGKTKAEMRDTGLIRPHAFLEHVSDTIGMKRDLYRAIKNDIAKRGICTPLDILPNNKAISGNMRLKIAKELGIESIPVNVIGLKGENEIKEFVIKENLLRHHWKPEQAAFVINELCEIYHWGKK